MAVEIKLFEGELREGNIVELYVDFTSDATAHLHQFSKWTVFTEHNVKYDIFQQTYNYQENNEGVIFQSIDSQYITIAELRPGRLFCRYDYTDSLGDDHTLTKVLRVLPKYIITLDEDIIKGDVAEFKFQTPSLLSTKVTWTFGDNAEVLIGTTVSRTFPIDGYFDVTIEADYSKSKHLDGDLVAWESTPVDKVAHLFIGDALYCCGTRDASEVVKETFTMKYLTKYNLKETITLKLDRTSNFTADREAPLRLNFIDSSDYGGLDYDPSKQDRLEFANIEFGDDDRIKFVETGFDFFKVYERSGTFLGTFDVNTLHTISGGPTYRQKISLSFSEDVKAFFTRWFIENHTSAIYNSQGFKDVAEAWGKQMDRLYNESKVFIDSIDPDKIDDIFLESFFRTYGDFIEIAEKIGFTSFVEDKEDIFTQFKDYNTFDRIELKQLTPLEKQEFVNYITSSRERLRLKGTPKSIEDAIAHFPLLGVFVDLYRRAKESENKNLLDEVFVGDRIKFKSGISYTNVSTPLSDNANQSIANSITNSYIEINTAEVSKISFYTGESETRSINGKEYVVVDANLV